MKKMIMLAAAMVMTLSMDAERTRVVTENFDKVTVNVPAHISLARGEGYGLDIKSRNGYAVRDVRWSIENGTLKINTADLATAEQRHGRLDITIISPEEPDLTIGNNFEVKDFQKRDRRTMR